MKCLAITKRWTRCKNDAETGRLFCYTHKGWLLGTTITSVGFMIAICAGLSQIFGTTLPNPLVTKSQSPNSTKTPIYTSTFLPNNLSLTFTSTPTLNTTWTPPPLTLAETPLPLEPSIINPTFSSYGGLTYGCLPTTYWQVDSDVTTNIDGCWDLNEWGVNSDDQSIRIDVDNSIAIEKTLWLSVSDFKNVDISFRLTVKDMRENFFKKTPKLAIGVCESNNLQFEHVFIYYDMSAGKLANAVTIDSLYNKDKYYFFSDVSRDYRLELRSYDLSIMVNNSLFTSPIAIKRTENTSFCIYYYIPDNGSLHIDMDNFFIEEK